jgi:hypothetical protein
MSCFDTPAVLDWSRACVDAVSVQAKSGRADRPEPQQTGTSGTKYHLLCDLNWLPLHAMLSAANIHDSELFAPLF